MTLDDYLDSIAPIDAAAFVQMALDNIYFETTGETSLHEQEMKPAEQMKLAGYAGIVCGFAMATDTDLNEIWRRIADRVLEPVAEEPANGKPADCNCRFPNEHEGEDSGHYATCPAHERIYAEKLAESEAVE